MEAERAARALTRVAAIALPIFALAEINYPHLRPQSQLAVFAAIGLALCFLGSVEKAQALWQKLIAFGAAGLAVLVCAYVVIQTEPFFSKLWFSGTSLGDRAGAETRMDTLVGVLGLVVVLEATRRSIGWVLPLLAGTFLVYAAAGASLPSWLLPHRGYGTERIVAQTFLHSQGVFGIALRVMFTYVFLFVLFGALLEATGATQFIVNAARRLFARSTGGAAKVAVLSSGLMGSLSGSAVANTATTGTFTIPLMRSAGFPRHEAAGVEAAASSGGALVPPVMGAGAYMMLEIVSPPVTYFEIIRAAFLPALLYYFSLFVIVHLSARKFHAEGGLPESEAIQGGLFQYEGAIFLGGLGSLIAFLIAGFSVFRSVSLALVAVVLLSLLHARTRLGVDRLVEACLKAAKGSVALVSAAACVGIVIGVVTLTGIGTRLPALILPLAQDHLILALFAIMVSSIVLGMGLPSAVCYLLMATLIGPVLGKLGVVPLAAHLFIFYFGMMSMVTPPVALAAYAASSIAGAKFLRSSWAAFRFALVGFALPFLFVYRPALLMLDPDGGQAGRLAIFIAVVIAGLGIVPLGAALTGRLFAGLGALERAILFGAALMILAPGFGGDGGSGSWGNLAWWNLAGALVFLAVAVFDWRRREAPRSYSSSSKW